jgi:hypothetical protein
MALVCSDPGWVPGPDEVDFALHGRFYLNVQFLQRRVSASR